jgi:hypothetical protein
MKAGQMIHDTELYRQSTNALIRMAFMTRDTNQNGGQQGDWYLKLFIYSQSKSALIRMAFMTRDTNQNGGQQGDWYLKLFIYIQPVYKCAMKNGYFDM